MQNCQPAKEPETCEEVPSSCPCPWCGEWVEDWDGFGVVAHLGDGGCGYCAHLSADGGFCNYCGAALCAGCDGRGVDSSGETCPGCKGGGYLSGVQFIARADYKATHQALGLPPWEQASTEQRGEFYKAAYREVLTP